MTFTHSNHKSDSDDFRVLFGNRPSHHSNILNRYEAHNGTDEATMENIRHEREKEEELPKVHSGEEAELSLREEEIRCREEELRCRQEELRCREKELHLREEHLHRREKALRRREEEERARQKKMADARLDDYCRRRGIDLEDISAEVDRSVGELTEGRRTTMLFNRRTKIEEMMLKEEEEEERHYCEDWTQLVDGAKRRAEVQTELARMWKSLTVGE
ncbi:MAG: hypothetical protein LQ350_005166 [Teloschistes chrysophthalmus]|nr:MAG: hypothetical protein LQ350_005166 [Niorma chrysophthalma]